MKEKKLVMHDVYQTINDLDKKMAQTEKEKNNLKTFISTKSKDMDY